jgi:protein ImuA
MFRFPVASVGEQMDLSIPRPPAAGPPGGRSLHGNQIETLRARIARMEHGIPRLRGPSLLLGPSIDAVLPVGGLLRGALHEVAGAGPDTEHGAAAALFVAGILARQPGRVLWVVEHADLFAPGLAAAGLHPDRVIYAEAGKPDAVMQAMEEGTRQPGLAGVVGEIGRLTLTASRRLQLAAETSGTIAFALRRSRRHDDPTLTEPSAAVTSWRIAALPSPPPLPHMPDISGLGRQCWRLELLRCRDGSGKKSWIVEACDATGRLGLVTDAGDRSAAPARQGFLSASGG